MAATVPAFYVHSRDPLYRLGLENDLSYCWLHSKEWDADRRRVAVDDRLTGQEIYVAFTTPSLKLKIDAHVRAWRGLANYHPGFEVNGNVLDEVIDDAPFHFSKTSGVWVFGKPQLSQAAGEVHHATWELELLFPEGANPSGSYPADPDGTGTSPIVIVGPPAGEGEGAGIDPETGVEALQTYRIFYDFTPAPGYPGATARSGYVTRIASSLSELSLGQLFSYGNPPAQDWQSIPCDNATDGPDWSDDDPHSDPAAVRIPGTYSIVDIYHLESETWLYESEEFDDTDAFESGSWGEDIIVLRTLAGEISLLIGDFPALADVLTYLELANATTLSWVWNARTQTAYHLVTSPPADPIAYWRLSTAQPVAPEFFQAIYLFGVRQSPSGTFHFLRVSRNNLETNAYLTVDFPTTPPEAHWNLVTGSARGEFQSVSAAYSYNTEDYLTGDSTAVSGLGLTPPSGGPDVWIFRYTDSGHGSANSVWDWIAGDYADEAAFIAAKGALSNFAVVYHANGNLGQGQYHKGSLSYGDPLLLTMGISAY